MGIRIDMETDYHQLVLEQVRSDRVYINVFKNARVAKYILQKWITNNQLCYHNSSLKETNGPCFAYKNDQCDGVCIGKEKAKDYNQRVAELAHQRDYPHNNCLVIGKGRKNGESSFIYIKNQVYRGYGFFELNHQIKTPKKILSRMTAMEDNSDCHELILSFIKKEKFIKLIPLVNSIECLA